jgi:hypothetical protein
MESRLNESSDRLLKEFFDGGDILSIMLANRAVFSKICSQFSVVHDGRPYDNILINNYLLSEVRSENDPRMTVKIGTNLFE